MLVLTRKVGERIHIGEEIVLTVVRIAGDRVRLGIEAPPRVVVHREEVHRRTASAGTAPAADREVRHAGAGRVRSDATGAEPDPS